MLATTLVSYALALAGLTLAHPHPSPNRPRHHAALAKRITGWDYIGCVVDTTPRVLTGAYYEDDSAMTNELCTAKCKSAGFSYAGNEYGSQCYCGNKLNGTLAAQSTDCNMPCAGNKNELCGAGWRLSMFKTTNATNPLTTPVSSKATSTVAATTAKTTTTAVIITTNKVTTTAKSSTTSTTTTATGPIPTASSIGCFTDDSTTRTLAGTESDITNMTPQLCLNYCGSAGYAYAGFEYGHQCFCGNSYVASRATTTSGCNMACDGDKTKICGGSNMLNVWSVPPCANGLKTGCNVKVTTYTAPASTSTTPKVTSTSVSTTAKVTSSSTSSKPSSATTGMGTTTANPTSTSVAPTSTVSTVGSPYSSVIGVAAPPAATGTKVLYAHHMLGNTYSYTPAIWADDIKLAAAAGIDGFALNMGSDSWQPARLADAYAAAKAQGSFKLFLSLDVTSLGCASVADAQNVAGLISTYANNTAQAKYSGKALVGTFSGEYCTFGQSSVLAGWNYVRSLVTAKGNAMYLVPAVFADPSTFSTASMAWMDGEFNWNSGWPMGNTPLTTASDSQYMAALPAGKAYMPAISPAFFTYYSPSSYNKDWIYRGDDWLLARRMEQMVQMRTQVDFAEIISWNDYGESHYIGPIRADQPNSQGWTNGMPHTAWLNVIAYYAPAFKVGAYPNPTTDSLFLWSRPHPKDAKPSAPSMARPNYADYTDDNLYALVILTAPAQVSISSGSKGGVWNLPKGLSKLSVVSAPGIISGKIVRSSATVKSYNSTGTFTYVATPTDYNFNYFVAQV